MLLSQAQKFITPSSLRRRIAVPEEALTVFGATVLSLMLEKGVRTQAQLLRLLEKEGCKASQSGFSNWLHGRHGANKDFLPAFARALKLYPSARRSALRWRMRSVRTKS